MRIVFWLLLIFLILVRYFTSRPVFKNGDFIKITTTVYSDTIDYSTSQYFKVAGLKVYLPKNPEINYGDEIVVEGRVENGELKNPKMLSLENGGVTSALHNKIVSFYQKTIPEPYAGLLSGIVLGAKGAVGADFYNLTKKAGVAHVVVASGMNVTFVASFLMGTAALFLPRRKAIVIVILGITLYLFVAGFDAPLVRAAVMGTVAFTVQAVGRVVSAWRIFLLTAGIMLVVNPFWVSDIGFILSFIATASLILFEQKIRWRLNHVPGFLKEGFSTSLAAQIGVAPILFVTFGQFNPLSPLINAIVLWTVAPLMLIGTVGGIVGLIFPFFGKLILWLGYPMLWWFVNIVQIFG